MKFDEMISLIALEYGLVEEQVKNAVFLLDDEKTIPFISRYRKEMTGSLDEIQLRDISARINYLRNLDKRKEEVIKSIDEQGKLSEELKNKIDKALILHEVEDLYLPYKKRKKTKADKAREKGLETLYEFLVSSEKPDEDFIQQFVNPELGVNTQEEAIQGAMDILREETSNNIDVRNLIRKEIHDKGTIQSEQSYGPDPKGVYKDLYSFSQKITQIPNHRIMALNRGEKEDTLKIKIRLEKIPYDTILSLLEIERRLYSFEKLFEAVESGITELLFPSVEREIRNELTDKAEERSISVFSKNLKNLLLTPPLKKKMILGIDPGFRTGCKCCVIDENGNFLETLNIYPHQPHNDIAGTEKILNTLFQKYAFSVVAIGNGTAGRESEELIANWIKKAGISKEVSYIIVSEAGASVYSASQNAIDEFPNLDVTARGAISIARRVQDPLAELVKIPPESIGVGMYQHDISEKKLSESLKLDVESVVNFVGVDLNTASPFLLQYISGLNKKTAWSIHNHRLEKGNFKNRKELKKVKGVGEKAFEQAAGFCRIVESENPLDNTIIHPESYSVAEKILDIFSYSASDLLENREKIRTSLKDADSEKISKDLNINQITVKDIISALTAPYLDPRDSFPQPLLKTDVRSVDDLKEGMVMQGTVRNVVDFGAFVDIGVKVDGLVHISKFGKGKIDPLKEVSAGQIVSVRILKIEKERDRISLGLVSEDQSGKNK